MFAINRDGAIAAELLLAVRPQTLTPHTAQWLDDDTLMWIEQGQLYTHSAGQTSLVPGPPVSLFRAGGRSWIAHLIGRGDPLVGIVHGEPLPTDLSDCWLGDVAPTGDALVVWPGPTPADSLIFWLGPHGQRRTLSAPYLATPPRFDPTGRGVVWASTTGWQVVVGSARLAVPPTLGRVPESPAAVFEAFDQWWIVYHTPLYGIVCHQLADPSQGYQWAPPRDGVAGLTAYMSDQAYVLWQALGDMAITRAPGFAPGFDMLPFQRREQALAAVSPETTPMPPRVAPFRFYAVCADPFGNIWSAESYIDDAQTADVRAGLGDSRTPIVGCPALGYLQIAAGRGITVVAGTGRDSSAQTLTVVRLDGRRVTLGPTLGTQQVQLRYLPTEDQFYVVAVIDAQTWGAWWLTPDLDVVRHTTAPLPQGIRGTSQGLLGITAGLEPVFTDQHRTIIRGGQTSTLTTFSDWYGQGWSIGQGGPKRSVVVGPSNTPAQLYIVPYEAPVPSSIALDATGQPWVGITGYGVKRVVDVDVVDPAPQPEPTDPPPPVDPAPEPETPTMMLPFDVWATYAATVEKYPHSGDDTHRRDMHKRAVATVRARHGLRWITKTEHATGWEAQSTDALAYVPGPVPIGDGAVPVRVPMYIWDMINGTTREVMDPHESEPLREAYALMPTAYDWLAGTAPEPPPSDPPSEDPDDPTETDALLQLLERLSDMEQALHARFDEIKAMQEILQNLILLQREHVSSLHSAFNQQAAALARGFQAKGRFLGMPITLDVTPKPEPPPQG